ncbi:ERCC4 domain protein [sediment metagenome]|uniref:ERCC4 domain protein n=1 Tax=sediment metagenome TaxID=749907 RepID=D9PK94_9ZZZZ
MKVIVDYREKASGIIDLLRCDGIQVEIRKVPYGDYVINNAITMERKTARDFLISLIDGRLFTQVSKMKKHCIHPTLLIEGNPFKTGLDFDEAAIRGAILSIQIIWYIPIIYSRQKEETKDIILMIGRQEEVYRDVVPLRGGYRPRRLKSRQLFLLQGLPRVGPTAAKRLLERFGSVANAVNAPIEDLIQVEGIGRVSAEKIREVLDIKS